MSKIPATAISIAATRDEIRAINLVATLEGINTSELVRDAVFARYDEKIREAAVLLAQNESRKNHSVRTLRAK